MTHGIRTNSDGAYPYKLSADDNSGNTFPICSQEDESEASSVVVNDTSPSMSGQLDFSTTFDFNDFMPGSRKVTGKSDDSDVDPKSSDFFENPMAMYAVDETFIVDPSNQEVSLVDEYQQSSPDHLSRKDSGGPKNPSIFETACISSPVPATSSRRGRRTVSITDDVSPRSQSKSRRNNANLSEHRRTLGIPESLICDRNCFQSLGRRNESSHQRRTRSNHQRRTVPEKAPSASSKGTEWSGSTPRRPSFNFKASFSNRTTDSSTSKDEKTVDDKESSWIAERSSTRNGRRDRRSDEGEKNQRSSSRDGRRTRSSSRTRHRSDSESRRKASSHHQRSPIARASGENDLSRTSSNGSGTCRRPGRRHPIEQASSKNDFKSSVHGGGSLHRRRSLRNSSQLAGGSHLNTSLLESPSDPPTSMTPRPTLRGKRQAAIVIRTTTTKENPKHDESDKDAGNANGIRVSRRHHAGHSVASECPGKALSSRRIGLPPITIFARGEIASTTGCSSVTLLSRSTSQQGSPSERNREIEGLLQKLRDPSTRNLGSLMKEAEEVGGAACNSEERRKPQNRRSKFPFLKPARHESISDDL